MARLQDFQTVSPASTDNILIVQPTGQGLATVGSTIGNKAPKTDLASISITGSTNNTGSTISACTFFYLNGSLVRAKTDIANGATLTANTNYETVTAGGLNRLLSYKGTLIKSESVSAEGSVTGFNCTGYRFVMLRVEGNASNTQDYLIPVGGIFKVASYIWATASINAYVPLELNTTNGTLTVRAIRLSTWGSVAVSLYGIF